MNNTIQIYFRETNHNLYELNILYRIALEFAALFCTPKHLWFLAIRVNGKVFTFYK